MAARPRSSSTASGSARSGFRGNSEEPKIDATTARSAASVAASTRCGSSWSAARPTWRASSRSADVAPSRGIQRETRPARRPQDDGAGLVLLGSCACLVRAASASALIRASVTRIPSRSSEPKLAWPPKASLVSLHRDVARCPARCLASLDDPGAAGFGGLQGERPDRAVVLDPEARPGVRLEAHHLAWVGHISRPRRLMLKIWCPSWTSPATHEGLDDLRAPGGHPGQVGDQAPRPGRGWPRPRWSPRAGGARCSLAVVGCLARSVGVDRSPSATDACSTSAVTRAHASGASRLGHQARPGERPRALAPGSSARGPSAARAGAGRPRRPRGPGRCPGSP